MAESVRPFQVFLGKLEGLLGQKEFMVGEITWVDFMVADLMQILPFLSQEYLKPFEQLSKHQKRIWGLPELSSYLSSGLFKERPFNSAKAFWR